MCFHVLILIQRLQQLLDIVLCTKPYLHVSSRDIIQTPCHTELGRCVHGHLGSATKVAWAQQWLESQRTITAAWHRNGEAITIDLTLNKASGCL